MSKEKTVGLSPKAVLAAILPTLGGIVAVLVEWVATGALDRLELATAVSAVAAAVLAFLGAYVGSPGLTVPPDRDVEHSHEARPMAEYHQAGYSLVELLVIMFVAVLIVVVLVALLRYV